MTTTAPTTEPALTYLQASQRLFDRVAEQIGPMQQPADLFAKTTLAGRMVHVFGSGHSRTMVEKMWPRYGLFPGFNLTAKLFANVGTPS